MFGDQGCAAHDLAVFSLECEGLQRHLLLRRGLCGGRTGHAGKRSVCACWGPWGGGPGPGRPFSI